MCVCECSSTPYNEMYRYDTENNVWTSLTATNEYRILGHVGVLVPA